MPHFKDTVTAMQAQNPARSLLICSGNGIDTFLDGLLTCALPAPTKLQYGFLLNTQGRVISDLFVWCYDQQHYLLDCPASDAHNLSQELLMRCFEPHLKISSPDNLHIVTSPTAPNTDTGWSAPDPRHQDMGWRSILKQPTNQPDNSYNQRRLAIGLPEGTADFPRSKALPLEYGIETLNTVAFDKGCFLGQEVCTRMYRRQTSKFCVRPFSCPKPPTAQTVLHTQDGVKIGTVVSSYPNAFFARIQLAHLQQHNTLLIAEDTDGTIYPVSQTWRENATR